MAIGILGIKIVNSALKKENISYHDFFPSGKSSYTDSDVIMYLIKLWEEELHKEKFNENKLYKILCCICSFFAKYCDENYDKFKVEIFLKLKDVKTSYTEFKEKNPLFINKEIDNLVEVLDKDLNAGVKTDDNQKENSTEENEDTDGDIKKISDEDLVLSKKLQEKINSQSIELEKRKKLIESLKKEIEKTKKQSSNEHKKTEKTLKEISEKEKIYSAQAIEIKKLEKKLEEIQNKYNEQLIKLQQLIEAINEKDKKIKKLNDIEEQRKQEIDKKLEILNNEQVTKKLIEDIILRTIIKNDISHKELLDIINKNGFNITSSELFNYLNSLSIKIKRDTLLDGYPIYKLDNSIEINKSLNINDTYCDFIFISGIKINRINNEQTLLLLEKIYDYCIINGIKYIVNLGNIFEVTPSTNYLEYIKNIENNTYEIIKNYPSDDNIQNIILGGSNEIDISKIGYNPIDNICNSRYDFYNLGYKNANININGIVNALTLYCINSINDYNSINEFINDKINKTGLSILTSDSTSIVDLQRRYITIPSLLSKGIAIYHIQINPLNDNVNNTTIMPLIDKQKLLVASQIHLI